MSLNLWGNNYFLSGNSFSLFQNPVCSLVIRKSFQSLLRTLTSLVAQMVNNVPAMQEAWVQFLGQKDPLEKGMATIHDYLNVNT